MARDALLFIDDRLSAQLRSSSATLSLLRLSAGASFEIHVADWMGPDS